MTGARGLRAAAGAALVLLFAWRAVEGVVGGLAWSAGRRLAVAGDYAPALPLIERGETGADRAYAAWLAGQVRLGLYQESFAGSASDADRIALLEGAYRDTTAAIAGSPASGWYWAALGDVFHQRERLARHNYGLPLELVGEGRIALVGRPGRIALGLTRLAIEREPNVFTFHDQLAFFLLDMGLRTEALEAVARSAAVLPLWSQHAYENLVPIPPDVIDAFLTGAREALDRAPLTEGASHRVALGKLEYRKGDLEAARADFEAALALPASPTVRAETHFFLGRALERLDRLDEAEIHFEAAAGHPVFAAEAPAGLARIAARRGETDRALELLWRARVADPGSIRHVLEFARVAGEAGRLDVAVETARGACDRWPDDRTGAIALVRWLAAAGKLQEAESLLIEYSRRFGVDAEVARLRAEIESAGTGLSAGPGARIH